MENPTNIIHSTNCVFYLQRNKEKGKKELKTKEGKIERKKNKRMKERTNRMKERLMKEQKKETEEGRKKQRKKERKIIGKNCLIKGI